MSTMASQIAGVSTVYWAVCPGADQRKHQSSTSLAFVRGIHRHRWIPLTKASDVENVSIWWCHHGRIYKYREQGHWIQSHFQSYTPYPIKSICVQFSFALFCCGYITKNKDTESHPKWSRYQSVKWVLKYTLVHLYQSRTKPKLVSKILGTNFGNHLYVDYQNW